MIDSFIMIAFLAKLKRLTSLIEENSFPDIGAVKGVPPWELKNHYSQNQQKAYQENKFDRRSQIYGTKRRSN